MLTSWNSHPFPRSTQLRSSVSWVLETAHPFPRSTQPFIPFVFSLKANTENWLFLAFRLGIKILNLLNRYYETTTSVTTECKVWISQVSNCNHRLSRLFLGYRHRNIAKRDSRVWFETTKINHSDTRGSIVLFCEKINGLQIKWISKSNAAKFRVMT